MSRRPFRQTSAVLIVLVTALGIWVARNTYWESRKIASPLKGEAILNPYYAAQHLSESLGAKTQWHRVFGAMPGAHDVLVLGAWQWDLVPARRRQIERWVESGGRLVVDRALIGSVGSFSRWSGIDRLESDEYDRIDAGEEPHAASRLRKRAVPTRESGCRRLDPLGFRLCGEDDGSKLVPMRAASWSLKDDNGPQVLRIPVGLGSVTVVNAQPFCFRDFLEGDHARLFVAASQLTRQDVVHFLTERRYPNLLTLVWLYGAPAVCLALGLIALGLWRNGVRLGPLIPPAGASRRSLGEQIRGTGHFLLRFGGGGALQKAEARALDEAATRRILGYALLSVDERGEEVARLVNLDADALSAAIRSAGTPRPAQALGAIELLETARRRILQIRKGI